MFSTVSKPLVALHSSPRDNFPNRKFLLQSLQTQKPSPIGEGFFCALLGKRLGSTNGRKGDKIISDEHGIGGTEFSNLIV